MSLVVDASVALKWFKQEDDSLTARELYAADRLLIAPELVVAEVLNAAWAAARRGQLEAAQVGGIARSLPRFFHRLVPLRDMAFRAATIAQALDHPVYDCFYLALAERENTNVVTSDGRLLARVENTPWAGHVRSLAAVGTSPG